MWRQRKTPSKNGTDKAKAVLELLSSNGSMTGEDIANQCSFESRMAAAGTIAKLVRASAIEAIPASYRITDSGRSFLATTGQEEPKKSRRKSKKDEPQEASSQGDQPSP